ncbi:DUF2059 domain-containing protein [Massilia dura]|uniref:DUF2059 domain-containing protein n=1 Tax=Pseudoduganella dura TaxID=321982 RepID=A0A6I3X609_9BURK|nr:DUF2059 domain-containing protein [Pseudoduganella dura]MUI12184.1 DUF2059 domain-containing protein [Pseudoduganella dura]GGX91438.1 hypothetical protein GCM10007386_22760 [Pseudoduganella dura]
MKKIAAVLLLSVAAVASTASSSALAQAAVPAPAAQAAVDPAAAAAVRELLVAMDYRNVVSASFRQMTAAMPAMIKSGAEGAVRNDPKLSDAERTKKLAELEQGLPKVVDAIGRMYADPALVDEMLEAMVPIYARHYTVDEMRQLATFYKTPVGVKSLRLMPQLMGEGMQVGQQIITPRMNKLMQELNQKQK